MRKVHLMLLAVNLIYAANYTIAKVAMPLYIKPFGLMVVRVICATLLFSAVHAIWVRELPERRDVPRLLLCAFFGVALNGMLFLKGLDLTTPINASLMMITTPIMVLLIAYAGKVEKLTISKLSGVLLAAFGAFIVIYWGKHFTVDSTGFIGDILVLINATSYAIFLVIVKQLMKKYHPLTVVQWVFGLGMIFVIPAGWGEFMEVKWQMPASAWLSIAYVVVGSTFFAYLLNVSALNRADPSLVGIYIYLQPVMATAIALSLGKDELNGIKIFASLLIFSGVYLAGRRRHT